ncbi:MAG: hypothetical protein M3529_13575 [Actinomycetota bacterium]|nr:hypothetical protein [Actinomycetota bacterium]
MEVVDVDPLAVLPLTASASASFARAADFSRDRGERQAQLRSLMMTFPSGEPTAVVLGDATGAEQAPRLSHAAATLRHISRLAVVTGSQPDRAVLSKVAGQSCAIFPPVCPLVQERPRGG